MADTDLDASICRARPVSLATGSDEALDIGLLDDGKERSGLPAAVVALTRTCSLQKEILYKLLGLSRHDAEQSSRARVLDSDDKETLYQWVNRKPMANWGNLMLT